MGTAETRARILGTAEQVFVARGIGPTTVQHLLDAANVSRRTFYQYFQSKEDVLSAIYDRIMGDLTTRIAHRIETTPDPVQKVTCTVDEWLDLQVAGGLFFVSLQTEAIRKDSLLHARREQALDAMAEAIGRGVANALGPVVDPLVWRGVALGIEGIVLHLAEGGDPTAERARLRRVANGLMFAVISNARDLPDPPRA